MNYKFISLLIVFSFIYSISAFPQQYFSSELSIQDGLGLNPFCIESFDFEKDGDSDLFIMSNSFLHFFNQSSPNSFDLEIENPGGFAGYVSSEKFDYNNDQYEDILVVTDFGRFTIAINNQEGVFDEEEIILDANINPSDLKVIDLNNDGHEEIIVSSFGTDTGVSYIPNLGNGSFGEIVTITGSEPYGFVWQIFPLDFDHDNDNDILILADTTISVLFNDGNGNFLTQKKLLNVNSLFEGIHLHDFNNDGFIDIYIEQNPRLYLNDGENNFENFTSIGPGSLLDIIGISTIADFDGDGDLDIIRGFRFNNSALFFLQNNGNGVFTSEELSNVNHNVENLYNSDLDGNGSPDLIIIKSGTGPQFTNELIWHPNLLSIPSVSGCNYFDENNNGIKEETERPISSILNKINTNNILYSSNQNSCYSYFINDGTYEISFQESQNWILSSDPSSYQVTVEGNSFQDLDFGFVPRDTFIGGLMHAVSGITRCNTDVRFDFTFQNQGTTIITEGTIFVFQDSLTELASTEFPIDTILNEKTFGFQFENLYPGETITRTVELSVPGLGGDIEPGTLIEIFSATEAKNTQGFVNFFKHNYAEEIRCAYDPNDKLISPLRPEDENYTLFGDTLVYTVRFQNTGNDTAFNVVIRDTLDQNLDVGTFNIIHSSHRSELSTDIQDGRNVTFNFENILLPDSTIDFIGSQGYVTYSIQANDPIPEFTSIENTASIFFDFNPPIVTNTTLSTMVSCYPIEEQSITATIGEGQVFELPDGSVVDQAGVYNVVIEDNEGCPIEIYVVTIDFVLGTSSLALQNAIDIAPNPNTGVFTLDLDVDDVANYRVVVSDPLGKEIKNLALANTKTEIIADGVASGVYFLQILDSDGNLMGVKKFVIF